MCQENISSKEIGRSIIVVLSIVLYVLLIYNSSIFSTSIDPMRNMLYLGIILVSLFSILTNAKSRGFTAEFSIGTLLIFCLVMHGFLFHSYVQSLQLLSLVLFGVSISQIFPREGILNILILGNICLVLIILNQSVNWSKSTENAVEHVEVNSVFLVLSCFAITSKILESRFDIFSFKGLVYIILAFANILIVYYINGFGWIVFIFFISIIALSKQCFLVKKHFVFVAFVLLVPLLLVFQGTFSCERFFIWKITAAHFREYAIVGKGVDSFCREYFLWQSEYFSKGLLKKGEEVLGNSIHSASSEFVQISVEFGILFLMGFLFLLFTRLWYLLQDNNIGISACLMCIIITCLFSNSLHCAPVFVCFVAMINYSKNDKFLRYHISQTLSILSIFVLAIIVSYIFERHRQMEKVCDRASFFAQAGDAKRAIQTFKPIVGEMESDGNILYNYSKVLLKYGKTKEALRILKIAKDKIGGFEVYTSLGYCFLQLGNRQEAEKYLTISRFAIPNSFIPRFYLLNLYERYGGTESQLKMTARGILSLPVNEQSKFINTIRATATRLLSARHYKKADYNRFSELFNAYENDSLKLACLNFILANLKNRYSVTVRYEDIQGGNVWNKLGSYRDGDINNFLAANAINLVVDTIFDDEQITTDYLRQNIDFALQRYQTGMEKYSLDTFCNYVLPYRVGTEPLVEWRDSLYKMYGSYLHSNGKSVVDLALYKRLRKDLDTWLKRDSPTAYSKFPQSPHQDVFTIMNVKYPYTCEVEALFTINTYRSLGIPSAYERIFTWGKFNFGHGHAAVMYSNGKFYPADYDTTKFKYQIAKMYRSSFSKTNNPFNQLISVGQDSINIPSQLNFENYLDITSERTPVSDMKFFLPLSIAAKNPAAFLCVYNTGKWIPVSWAKRNANYNSYRFENMGRKMLYHLAVFERGRQKLVGSPVILDTLGNQYVLKSSVKMVEARVKMFDRYHLVVKGKRYSMFIWQPAIQIWKKAASVVAEDEYVTFSVPENMLLKIEQDHYDGDAVRPFTFDCRLDKQVWW